MKIIQVHNYYQQVGGEDSVVAAEKNMLAEAGHEVILYYKNNDGIVGAWQLIVSSLKTLWNYKAYSEFRQLLKNHCPDVVHCHNTFPLISPAIYWACEKEGVPVVQTLHNYRLLCLNSQFFRYNKHNEAEVCEKCHKRAFKFPGIKYRCYKGSMAGSVVVALMLFLHRLLGTWKNKVSVYIALTEFQKQKMSKGGLPADRIFVKPNFVRSETEKEPIECYIPQSPYALFVGRLSPEKGCTVLLQAWKYFLESCDLTQNVFRPELLVVGDGPDKKSLEQWSEERQLNRVRFTGMLPRNQVQALMKRAEFLILPSLWYEGFPMAIVEAFSCGTPVLASDLGGMKEIIEEGVTGRKFTVGDVRELAEKMNTMFNSEELVTMRAAVHNKFERDYSESFNLCLLLDIYKKAGCAS